MARPKVVVVGGGPYGINACKALTKTADVTLIEAKEFHEIQWGAPCASILPEAQLTTPNCTSFNSADPLPTICNLITRACALVVHAAALLKLQMLLWTLLLI